MPTWRMRFILNRFQINLKEKAGEVACVGNAETRDRTGDLQIFSLTLSQLSYRGIGLVQADPIKRLCGNIIQVLRNFFLGDPMYTFRLLWISQRYARPEQAIQKKPFWI